MVMARENAFLAANPKITFESCPRLAAGGDDDPARAWWESRAPGGHASDQNCTTSELHKKTPSPKCTSSKRAKMKTAPSVLNENQVQLASA